MTDAPFPLRNDGFLARALRHPSFLVGGVICAFVAGAALLSLVWTPYDPTAIEIARRLRPPSEAHWLGTDPFGRDTLSMILRGAVVSIAVSFVAVGIGAGIGVPLGLLAVPVAARTALPDSLPLLVAAFALHRLFDITKPFPCRQLEHLPAGLGIMADDWGAAAWMAVALTACRWCGWL